MQKSKASTYYTIPDDDLNYRTENLSKIMKLFRKQKFSVEYRADDSLLIVTTPVGKWKMLTDRRPVRLLHISLYHEPDNVNEYHQQRKMFESLKDTYKYIVNHERCIARIVQESKVK